MGQVITDNSINLQIYSYTSLSPHAPQAGIYPNLRDHVLGAALFVRFDDKLVSLFDVRKSFQHLFHLFDAGFVFVGRAFKQRGCFRHLT